MSLTKVADKSEVAVGECKLVQVGDEQITVLNVDGEYYAIANMCTHRGGPLSEGDIKDGTVTCPWHGAKFDVTTGLAQGGPTDEKLQTYDVEIVGDEIHVEVP